MKNKVESVIANKVKQSHKIELEFNRLLRHSFLIPRNDLIKKLLFLFIVLFSINGFAQVTNFKEYSYSEVFNMIAQEKDSLFKLSDAFVRYNPKSDSLFTALGEEYDDPFLDGRRKNQLIIDKELAFNNVHFISRYDRETKIRLGVINNIVFKKKVSFRTVLSSVFYNCIFEEALTIQTNTEIEKALNDAKGFRYAINVNSCKLLDGAQIQYSVLGVESPDINIHFFNNDIYFKKTTTSIFRGYFYFFTRNISNNRLTKNKFHSKGFAVYNGMENYNNEISGNEFNDVFADFNVTAATNSYHVYIENNSFHKPLSLNFDELSVKYRIPYQQFNGIIYRSAFYAYGELNNDLENLSDTNIAEFYNSNFRDEVVYDESMSFKGRMYNFYKSKFDTEDANAVYVEMKDLETTRLQYLHQQNPSFKSFFTVKINQFLKVFSAYGTEPARAVIFSMYVILLFAFIYLLFPNSWDAHGKKRLMHRFEFFQKYLRRDEGMHTIYLEDKQLEISSYQDFKNNLEEAKLELPSFFVAWSKPLYNASMFSSIIMTKFLKTTDVLSGKWKDLTPKQKRWKNIQIGFLLMLGLFYDILIKMLNALMLSINTFTTLGFGEIPIKGLPRYLAIIQGFIGWFMLTIFSVSLISQLLN